MPNKPRKRQIIITIDDYCNNLPFEKVDLNFWNNQLSKILMDYDIEIEKIEIKDLGIK